MPPQVIRVLVVTLSLLGATGLQAQAATVSCPTQLSLNGAPLRDSTGSPGRARLDPQNNLLCLYTGVNFYLNAGRPSGGACPPLLLRAAVSGGTGTWSFGTPGSPATLIPPVQPVNNGCQYGAPTFYFPNIAVWRSAPAGQSCVPSATDGSAFTCTGGGAATTATTGATTGATPGALAGPTPGGSCPASLAGTSLPAEPWSETATAPGYYAPDSFILNANDGKLVQGNAPLKAIETAMGPAFGRAIFMRSGTRSANLKLPIGSYVCNYEGPRFTRGNRTLEATVSIACNGSCAFP